MCISLIRILTTISAFFLAHVSQGQGQEFKTPACAVLVLAIDGSGSTGPASTEHHFSVQIEGHAKAFRDSRVHQAIDSCAYGRLVAAAVTWSSSVAISDAYKVCVPLTSLESASDAIAFAEEIESACSAEYFGEGTDLSAALAGGRRMLQKAAEFYDSLLWIIDVSGNGPSRNGNARYLKGMRASLESEGNVTVNSLVLEVDGNCEPGEKLYAYFDREITLGPRSFTMCAEEPNYADILLQKILLEIAGLVPERFLR